MNVSGIAWYRREDYDRLKAMFPDGWDLPDTFDDWLSTAQELFDVLTSAGQVVEKAYIDPETFPQWCIERGRKMDTQGRIAYGSEYAAKKHKAQ